MRRSIAWAVPTRLRMSYFLACRQTGRSALRLRIGEVADDFGELDEARRLFECRGGVELVEAIGVRAGQNDDGDAGDRRLAPLRLAELETVHHRHSQIEHDDARGS